MIDLEYKTTTGFYKGEIDETTEENLALAPN